MARIALVRGHHLSKEETISYELLKDEFSFHCFSSNAPWFDHRDIVFPITYLPTMERALQLLPANFGRRLAGVSDNLLGTGQWMPGLSRHLTGFDIVHTSDYCHLFTLQAARAKRALGFKLMAIHYDNIPFARDRKPLARAARERVYREVDLFGAMSERARQSLLLEGVPASRVTVIGNAVDTAIFRPRPEARHEGRARYNISADEVVVLFVGRLHDSKGVVELVHAARKLADDPELSAFPFRILMAGKGKKESDLRQLIGRFGLGDRVKLIGGVPHRDIHLLYPLADIFTLPSIAQRYWQEQFGIVLIEAMACGLAVISTHSGSIPEVLGDAGMLVQPADHYSLYLGLKSLIVDSQRRSALRTRSIQRAQSVFGLPRIAGLLRDAYRTLLSQR